MATLHNENGQQPDSGNLHGYEFDSQASPEQKREVALKAVPVGLKTEKRNRGEEIISDLSSKHAIDMPAASSTGAVEQAHESKAQELARQGGTSTKIGCETIITFCVSSKLMGKGRWLVDRVVQNTHNS